MSRAGAGHTARRAYRARYPAVSVCGLSCRLCPRFHTSSRSRCGGCKSAWRMGAGCALVTCAFKRKGLETCALCRESAACGLLRRHRESGKRHDSFVSYRPVEANARFIAHHGVARFDASQKKGAVLPTIIIKEEDRKPLRDWQRARRVAIHIWHAFYDEAHGISLTDAERLISEGSIEPTRQVFQAPGGATTEKVIYKIYYRHAYPLATTVEEPKLVADSITDKNGHILPYVRFVGGKSQLSSEAITLLNSTR